MPDYADTLSQLVAAREEAREILKELHGATKDAQSMKKEVQQFVKEKATTLVVVVLNHVLEEKMQRLDTALTERIETFHRKISSGTDVMIDNMNRREVEIERNFDAITSLTDTLSSLNLDEVVEEVARLKRAHEIVHEEVRKLQEGLAAMFRIQEIQKQKMEIMQEYILELLDDSENNNIKVMRDGDVDSD